MCVCVVRKTKAFYLHKTHIQENLLVSESDSIQFASHLTRKSIAFITLHDPVFEHKTATVFPIIAIFLFYDKVNDDACIIFKFESVHRFRFEQINVHRGNSRVFKMIRLTLL